MSYRETFILFSSYKIFLHFYKFFGLRALSLHIFYSYSREKKIVNCVRWKTWAHFHEEKSMSEKVFLASLAGVARQKVNMVSIWPKKEQFAKHAKTFTVKLFNVNLTLIERKSRSLNYLSSAALPKHINQWQRSLLYQMLFFLLMTTTTTNIFVILSSFVASLPNLIT